MIQERRKREKDKLREQEEPSLPGDPVADILAPAKIDTQSMVQYQERETIRLLLNYADKNLVSEQVDQTNQKLSDFLVHELEDVEFTNVVFREIYEKFKEGLSKGEPMNSDYFITKGSNAIKSMVTDLITSRYETSKHWNDKFHIYFPKEPEILNQLAYTNVLRLKFRVVQKMMEDNLQELKKLEPGGDLDKIGDCLGVQAGLKQAELELADLLGIVVSK